MPDAKLELDRRLRGVDDVRVPDLWPAARDRAADDAWRSTPETPGRRRLVTAGVALALTAAATGALVWSFRNTEPAPTGSLDDGVIVIVGRGQDSLPGIDNTDLVAIDPATGGRWNITNTPEAESQPAWSADGTRVAFIRTTTTDDGATFQSSVMVMELSNGATREVFTCRTSPCAIRTMVWSPDDNMLAMVTNEERPGNGDVVLTKSAALVVIDVGTAQSKLLCGNGPCALALGSVTWSPDGRSLAFAGSPFVIPGPAGPQPSSVWTAAADGSSLDRLTEGDLCRAEDQECFADTGVTWSPDGSALAFRRESSDFGVPGDPAPLAPELVVMAPDGSEARSFGVCAGSGDIQLCQPSWPVWSVDGSEILTAIDYHPRSAVAIDVRTGATRTMASNDGGPCDLEGATGRLTPDGRSIYVETSDGKGLCVLPVAGGRPTVFLRDLRAADRFEEPAWLPGDGFTPPSTTPTPEIPAPIDVGGLPVGTLAFASTNASPDGPSGAAIWIDSAEDPTARIGAEGPPYAREPDLARDGTRLVFAVDANDRLAIWTADIDGRNLRRLTNFPGNVSDPAWSPDGSRIAFVVDVGRGQTQGLSVMDSDGTNPRTVWEGQPFGPVWTPDGTGITFAKGRRDGDFVLETLDVATGEVHPVLPLSGSLSDPAWSPDGTTIAFRWDTSSGSGVYMADADGTNVRRVPGTDLDGSGSIAWSPDGEWLAFQGSEEESGEQIYVVRTDGSGLRRVTDMRPFHPGPGVSGPNGTPGRTGDPSWGPSAT